MKFKFCLLVCCLFLVLQGTAGAHLSVPAADSVTPKSLTVSILLGTSGGGAGLRLPLHDRWSLRAGATWMPFNFSIPGSIGSRKVESRFDNAVGAVHLMADYTPFLNKKGFRVSAGLAYFFAMKSTMVLHPKDGYDFGDLSIDGAALGQLTATVTRPGLAPYLGIGLLKVYENNRFHVSFDLGTYFLAGKLKVKIDDSGFLSGNERNEAVLKQNLENYRWLPLLQVAFNYRFGL